MDVNDKFTRLYTFDIQKASITQSLFIGAVLRSPFTFLALLASFPSLLPLCMCSLCIAGSPRVKYPIDEALPVAFSSDSRGVAACVANF